MSPEVYQSEEPSMQNLEVVDGISNNLNAIKNHPQFTGKLDKAIEDLRDNPKWQSKVVDGFWNKLSDEDKVALYNRGENSLGKHISPLINKIGDIFSYDAKKLKIFGSSVAPAIRALVQLNLLPAPSSVAQDVILQDIEKDHKRYRTMLKVSKVAIKFIAPEFSSVFDKIEPIAKQIDAVKTNAAKRQHQASGQQGELLN